MSRRFLLVLVAMACAPALAATGGMTRATVAKTHATLNVSTGLWEVTVTPKLSGQLPISDAELARIPAAQRAKFMAAMQGMSGRTRKMRECLTQDKLNEGFSLGDREGCTSTVVANTASAMEVREACQGNSEGLKTVDVKFIAGSTTSVTGQAHMVVSRGGKTMKIDDSMSGSWISSSCGNVKDVEVVQ